MCIYIVILIDVLQLYILLSLLEEIAEATMAEAYLENTQEKKITNTSRNAAADHQAFAEAIIFRGRCWRGEDEDSVNT